MTLDKLSNISDPWSSQLSFNFLMWKSKSDNLIGHHHVGQKKQGSSLSALMVSKKVICCFYKRWRRTQFESGELVRNNKAKTSLCLSWECPHFWHISSSKNLSFLFISGFYAYGTIWQSSNDDNWGLNIHTTDTRKEKFISHTDEYVNKKEERKEGRKQGRKQKTDFGFIK